MPLDDTIKTEQNTAPAKLRMTLDDLPSPKTRRWVISRKAAVVDAVKIGLITIEEACSRYALSIEEFQTWQNALEKNGVAGLRVTRVQQYR